VVIWPILLLTMMEQSPAVSRDVVFYPFLRTLIDCGNHTSAELDHSSKDWSGSQWCDDRCHVAEQAQLVRGIANGVEQMVQCISMPIVGVIADSIGRKPVAVFSAAGMAVSVFFYAMAALAEMGPAAKGLVVAGSIVKGATESFFMLMYVMVADAFRTGDERGMVYSMLQTMKALTSATTVAIVTGAVLFQYLNSYLVYYLVLTALGVMVAVMTAFVMKETLPQEQHKPLSWQRASPWSQSVFFAGKPHLTIMAAVIFLFVCGFSVLIIIQAFVIAAYGWRQTTSTMIFIGFGLVAIASMGAGFFLIRQFGSRKIFSTSLVLATIGCCILCFASISPVFFFVGGICMASAAAGNPAYLAIISEMVPSENQGQVQGGISACALFATAICMPGYSSMFAQLGAGGECDKGEKNSFVWLPFGIGTIFMVLANGLLALWMGRYPAGTFEAEIHATTYPEMPDGGSVQVANVPEESADVPVEMETPELLQSEAHKSSQGEVRVLCVMV